MRLIGLTTNDDDDPGFIKLVQRIIHGVVSTEKPRDYCVVRIDNWFGERWLNFSGKLFGALGVRKTPTTFPPFVPNRIRSFTLFTWDPEQDDYRQIEETHPVHKWQHSGTNLQNFVSKSFPDAAFFWFSGHTKQTHQGSLMTYVASNNECWTWYVGYKRNGDWKQAKLVNIAPAEIGYFLNKCLGHTKGTCPT